MLMSCLGVVKGSGFRMIVCIRVKIVLLVLRFSVSNRIVVVVNLGVLVKWWVVR